MSETIPPPKKMVSRNVAVALGIISIVLIVGLFGAVLQIFLLNESLNLNNSVVLVYSRINLGTSDIQSGTYVKWHFPKNLNELGEMNHPVIPINNAGYISANIQSSANNTYVRVIYSYQGRDNQTLNYDNQLSVTSDSALLFNVLPTNSLEIRVGITNGGELSANVTITYCY
jgi:hypothetical protein